MRYLVHVIAMEIGVFIASLAQVLLKSSALRIKKNDIKEYLNWRVVLAYMILIATTWISVFAYEVIPVSLGSMIDATGYLYVAVFGIFIFEERMSIRKWIGLFIIMSGITVYSLFG